MRIVHAIFCLILVAFTLVQYNDPDFYFWMPIYGVPAVLAAIAAWSPAALSRLSMQTTIGICTVLSIIGTYVFWPHDNDFWRKEVFWESEAAREGMGMMIVTVALLLLATSALRRSSRADELRSG